MKKSILIALGIAAAAALLITPQGAAIAQEVRSVFVTNFPKTFNISGTVSVEGPVKQAKLAALREVVVPP
jgi:hypothetical protein